MFIFKVVLHLKLPLQVVVGQVFLKYVNTVIQNMTVE